MADDVVDLAVPRGRMETTTWSEVGLGSIVRDKNDRMHTVTHDDGTYVRLLSAREEKPSTIRRPPGDRPVDVYVPTERECLNLLMDVLGAGFLREIEDREHTIARQLLWRVDPVANSAKDLRDHIDLIHGQANVDVLLSRHTSAKENAKAAKAARDPERVKAADAKARLSIKELRAIHDELHSDPHVWPMAFPHHHAQIGAP